ncbi:MULTISPECIES: acetyl-CoA carboxylase biotin carboxyl carrier protein [unclassified Cryobacterium]|uniref:acetyl-CoA carboxylase biotin carboxyl carrier protein n=1 Tax=unclassified Cryobacterium TaxID=2649013 RepID=UPI0018ECDC1A|nr:MULTISPECIES: acetyl-CoA carboxylase biotin carboxyl carrier protein [unclassified Cryobacterium]
MSLNPPDIKELQKLVDWVNLTDDVRELSIKFGEVELFISRDRQVAGRPAVVAPAPVLASALSPAAVSASAMTPTSVVSAPVASAPSPATDLAVDEVHIKAPMVGTYYAAPKPGASAFVQVGDSVVVGTVLCIVEVMKLMSTIEAQFAGIVTQILVDDEQAVEYGQPLLVIRRNG